MDKLLYQRIRGDPKWEVYKCPYCSKTCSGAYSYNFYTNQKACPGCVEYYDDDVGDEGSSSDEEN